MGQSILLISQQTKKTKRNTLMFNKSTDDDNEQRTETNISQLVIRIDFD